MNDLEKAVVNWYRVCYIPNLSEEPTAVHWATKALADKARELSIQLTEEE